LAAHDEPGAGGSIHRTVQVEPIGRGFSTLRTRFLSGVLILAALAGVLLLIMCANIAALLGARAENRSHSWAVQVTLGATRWRLLLQLLIEMSSIALSSATIAIIVVTLVAPAVGGLLWNGVAPLSLRLSPDWRVMLTVFGLALLIAATTASVPSIVLFRTVTGRRSSTRTVTTRPAGALAAVSIQLVLALALTFGALLLAKSMSTLTSADLGFDPDGLAYARLTSQPGGYVRIDRPAYVQALVTQIRGIPGVTAVGTSHFFPLIIDDDPPLDSLHNRDTGAATKGTVDIISPGFIGTARIPLLDGRDFTWFDRADRAPVALVSQTIAHELFPKGSPLGRTIAIGEGSRATTAEVVGLVADASLGGPRRRLPLVFRPILQEPRAGAGIVLNVRSGAADGTVLRRMRSEVQRFGHDYVLTDSTLQTQLLRATAQARLLATLAIGFAAISVMLALSGIYALNHYVMTRRRREIAIRLALGCTPRDIVALSLRQGSPAIVVALVIGGAAATWVGAALSAQLYKVSSHDPVLLATAILVAFGVAFAGVLIPTAWHARIDPASALRGID
jgi:predicted permease